MTSAGPTFVLATYGSKYLPMVYGIATSILRHMPEGRILLFWSDTPAREIDILAHLSPRIEFYEKDKIAPILPKAGQDQVISQKMLYWHAAMQMIEGGDVILIDTDTILLQPLNTLLAENFDLVLTYRHRGFLINTGVVIVRQSARIVEFMQRWTDETTAILSNTARAAEAVAINGGADQHALVEVAGYNNQTAPYLHEDIKILPVKCEILNELRCVPQTQDKLVYHLKGGWHPILLEGKSFSGQRPRASCAHILESWLEVYRSGCGTAFTRFADAAAPVGSGDAAMRIGQLAERLGSSRIVIFTKTPISPRKFHKRFGTAIEIVVLPETAGQRVRRRLASDGSPALICWDLTKEEASQVVDLLAFNADITLICSTLTRAEHDAVGRFPFYRTAELGTTLSPSGETRTISASSPTYLDYVHRRRNPDWVSMLGDKESSASSPSGPAMRGTAHA